MSGLCCSESWHTNRRMEGYRIWFSTVWQCWTVGRRKSSSSSWKANTKENVVQIYIKRCSARGCICTLKWLFAKGDHEHRSIWVALRTLNPLAATFSTSEWQRYCWRTLFSRDWKKGSITLGTCDKLGHTGGKNLMKIRNFFVMICLYLALIMDFLRCQWEKLSVTPQKCSSFSLYIWLRADCEHYLFK